MQADYRLGAIVDPDEVGQRTRWAEELGLRSIWGSEAGADPFLPLVSVAAASKRIELGTGIAVAFARSPYATAHAAWYLHRISGGRMVLGLGTQVRAHIERRYGMPWHGAGRPLVEYIQCLREIWGAWTEARSPSYEGTFFSCTLSNPEFEPLPLPEGVALPEVWIATVGDTLARLVSAHADGIHVHAFHTGEYLRDVLVPACRAARSEAGVTADLRLSTPVMAGVVHDELQRQELRDVYRQIIAFYSATKTYAPVLASIGFDDLVPLMNELSRAKRWDDMARLVPNELLDAMTVIGDAQTVGETLRTRYDGLLTQLSLYRGGDRFMSDDDHRAYIAALTARDGQRAAI